MTTFTRTEILSGRARASLKSEGALRRGFKAGGDAELTALLELKNDVRRKALVKHLVAEVEAELKELGVEVIPDAE